MASTIHRAIFGEKNAGHAVLSTTLPNPREIQSLITHTDLPADAPPGLEWRPFVRGFPFENWYILAKTYPDPSATRSGMVRTHALLLEKSLGASQDNIAFLLALLPAQADLIWTEQTPAEDDSMLEIPPSTTTAPARFSLVVRGLLAEARNRRPVVWAGQDDFEAAVCAVWKILAPCERQAFQFGLVFSPQGLNIPGSGIVSVPESLVFRWAEHTVLRRTDPVPDVITAGEAFLLNRPEGNSLQRLFSQLEIEKPSLAQVADAQRSSGYLDRFDEASSEQLRGLLVHVIALCPDSERGVALKCRILTRLIDLVASGSADDVSGLRLLENSAFRPDEARACGAIAKWLCDRLVLLAEAQGTLSVVAKALEKPAQRWSRWVLDGVRCNWKEFRTEYAEILWAWWQHDPQCVETVSKLLPGGKSIEALLVDTCPPKLSGETGRCVRDYATSHRFLKLHAVVATLSLPADEAFGEQIAVDTDPASLDGLRAIYDRVPESEAFKSALGRSEGRLHRIAGEHPSARRLLIPFRPDSPPWQQILFYALSSTPAIWHALPNRQTLVNALLDQLLAGKTADNDLLAVIAQNPEASLVDYPQRRKIWPKLPHSVCDDFANATADGWITRYREAPGFEQDVETVLQRLVFYTPRIHRLLDVTAPNAVTVGLSVFSNAAVLREENFREWLKQITRRNATISEEESRKLGRLIAGKQWRKAADDLSNLKRDRQFGPALRECFSLFDRLTRLFLGFYIADDAPTPADFWDAFLETATRLYPKGPDDQNVWKRASGDLSDLDLRGSGKDQWVAAIDKLRHGGGRGISAASLLNTMQKDFHRNEELKSLAATWTRLQPLPGGMSRPNIGGDPAVKGVNSVSHDLGDVPGNRNVIIQATNSTVNIFREPPEAG